MKDSGRFAVNELVAGKTVYSVNHGTRPIYRAEGMEKWVLNYTVSGTGIVNKRFKALPGDLLLFPPGVTHDYISVPDDDWVHLWVYFAMNTRLTGLLNWPEINAGVLGYSLKEQENKTEIEALLNLTVETWMRNLPKKINFCYNLLERVLLFCDLENPLSENSMDQRIKKAMEYMNRHISEKIALSEIAIHCGMSVSRFVHLFTETTGISPIKYLEKARVEKAQGLLIGSNMKLAEIAERTGYINEYYFSKVFKKLTGTPPGKFRKYQSN